VNFGCTILHRLPSESREGGILGYLRGMGGVYMLWWCIKIHFSVSREFLLGSPESDPRFVKIRSRLLF